MSLTRNRFESVVRVATGRDPVDGWALVLASAGIPHRVEHTPVAYALLVGAWDAQAAIRVLEEYDRETGQPAADVAEPPAGYGRGYSGVVLSAWLAIFFFVTGGRAADVVWFRQGSASAERILDGEWYRAVTALTLHADLGHILGNALIGGLFFTVLFRWLGTGVGGWLLLLGGTAGNLINAAFYGARHNSIGASTAVFAAIGVLGALQFVHRRRIASGRLPPWVAIGASLALLAMLGMSEHSDVMAHVFGFVAGLAFGLPTALALRKPPGKIVQWFLASTAAAAVVLAWWVAL